MARKLIVEILGDSKSLERSFTRSSAAANKFGRDVDTGVGRAEGTVLEVPEGRGRRVRRRHHRSSRRSQAIKSVVVAASESQQVLGQTKVCARGDRQVLGRLRQTDRGHRPAAVQARLRRRGAAPHVQPVPAADRDVDLVAQGERRWRLDIARARFIDLETGGEARAARRRWGRPVRCVGWASTRRARRQAPNCLALLTAEVRWRGQGRVEGRDDRAGQGGRVDREPEGVDRNAAAACGARCSRRPR